MSLEEAIKNLQDKRAENRKRLEEKLAEDMDAIKGNPEVVEAIQDLDERLKNIEEHLGI